MAEAEAEEVAQKDPTGLLVEEIMASIIHRREAAAGIVVGGWAGVEAEGVGEGGKAAGGGAGGGGRGEATMKSDDVGWNRARMWKGRLPRQRNFVKQMPWCSSLVAELQSVSQHSHFG